tara:strand:+ start:1011 stop:1292 length:282 start_codon:yes stop_codon:yes gene_type:complete
MVKAVWKGVVLAESDSCIEVEGNRYFPPKSIKKEFFKENNHHTICTWKGEASYYDIIVNGETNENAAWYYPNPKEEAKNIKGYVAFWKGVMVS